MILYQPHQMCQAAAPQTLHATQTSSCVVESAAAGTLPVMGIAFFFMLRNWLGAVNSLSDYQVQQTSMSHQLVCHLIRQM